MTVKSGTTTAFDLQKGKGRQKGSSNKKTVLLKDMILGALDKSGGVDYLVAQARENPAAFMSLIGRVLPMTVTGADGGALTVIVQKPE